MNSLELKELISYQDTPLDMFSVLVKLHNDKDPLASLVQCYTLGVIMGKRMERERRKAGKRY